MLVTQQKVLRRFWYPVIPADRLTTEPVPFTLLSTDLVLFRDSTGSAAALVDRCCHRTAKLSKGWIEGGNVVCPYHGWTYAGDGRCVRIPQRPGGDPGKNVAVELLPLHRALRRDLGRARGAVARHPRAARI